MPFLFAGAKVRQLFRSAKSFTNFFHFFLLFSAFCREGAALPPQKGLKEGEGGGSRKGARRRGIGRGRKGPAALPYLIIYMRARGNAESAGTPTAPHDGMVYVPPPNPCHTGIPHNELRVHSSLFGGKRPETYINTRFISITPPPLAGSYIKKKNKKDGIN